MVKLTMIRKYPTGDNERDAITAPKRDGLLKLGEFGVVVYTYRLALESHVQTNMKDTGKGELYHPVDTPEEAKEWIEFYKNKTRILGFERRPEYEKVYFIPRG